MKVTDVMHKGLECVSSGASVSTVAQKMKQFDVGAIPVTDGGELIGMITDRDIVVRCLANGRNITDSQRRM